MKNEVCSTCRQLILVSPRQQLLHYLRAQLGRAKGAIRTAETKSHKYSGTCDRGIERSKARCRELSNYVEWVEQLAENGTP
jgi:hypothetical protein